MRRRRMEEEERAFTSLPNQHKLRRQRSTSTLLERLARECRKAPVRSLSMCQYSLPSLPSPSSPGEEILRFQRQFVARLGPANSFAPPPPGRVAKSLVSLPSQPKSRLVPRTLLPTDPGTTLMTRDP